MALTDPADWLNLLSQQRRFLTLDCAIDGLIVEQIHGTEAINDDFHFEIHCLSASAFLNLQPLLGTRARLAIADADGHRRYWQGYVTEARAAGADGGLARYQLVMRSALAFLRLRRNTVVFQNQTALDIIGQVAADHPELVWRSQAERPLRTRAVCTQYRESDYDFVHRLLSEEGLSYRFEHDQTESSEPGVHHWVIFDAPTEAPVGTPENLRFHRIDATEREDAITAFSDQRGLVPTQVTTASWRPDQVQSIASEAAADRAAEGPELPDFDVFEADRGQRFDDAEQARRYAQHRLDALRLPMRQHDGTGSVRTLECGKRYILTAHPELDGHAFIPVKLEHWARSNLSPAQRLAARASANDEAGSYRNHFIAIPAGTPISPPHRDKPVAPGCQSALVVGLAEAALSSNREHQVCIQFPWVRPRASEAPLPARSNARPGMAGPGLGGNEEIGRAMDGGSQTDFPEQSLWVRVTELAAGAHHGHSFVPRVGSEVLVEFAHGDIDQPVIVGQLYNALNPPPFTAGVGSTTNHPGTLTGIRTQTLSGQPSNQWLLDDASGQLRQTLTSEIADSQLHLGYLIAPAGAHRGPYRGEGFELRTEAWAALRAGEGLLVSSQSQTEAASTQMNAELARDLLLDATASIEALARAATAAQTQVTANARQTAAQLQKLIDPRQEGRHPDEVNGQPAKQSDGSVIERFAEPAIVLESPDAVALTSRQSLNAYAGARLHGTAQHDLHLAAGAAFAGVSGDGASLYTAAGGIRAIAQHGPVSLEAHTAPLQILADQSLSITSTTDRVEILAKDQIVLQCGESRITLKDGDITFTTPGAFVVKAGQHLFQGAKSQAAQLPALPKGVFQLVSDSKSFVNSLFPAYDEQFELHDPMGHKMADIPFRVTNGDEYRQAHTRPSAQTDRVVTQAPQAITFSLRWFELKKKGDA